MGNYAFLYNTFLANSRLLFFDCELPYSRSFLKHENSFFFRYKFFKLRYKLIPIFYLDTKYKSSRSKRCFNFLRTRVLSLRSWNIFNLVFLRCKVRILRTQNFAKSPSYFCLLTVHRAKVRWIFRKIF